MSDHDYLWNKRWTLLDRLELSICYHRERERFLSACARWITAIAIIGGSAAFAGVAGHDLLQWGGLVVAASSTLSLVFGLPERARLHGELASRFGALRAQMAACGERDFTEQDIAAWESELHRIEMDEPPQLAALVRLCQNRLKHASGQDDMVVPMPWWQRLTAQLLSYG
jgi:hypothetical protein